MNNDVRLICELYEGKWDSEIIGDVDLPDGRYKAFQSGYTITIEGEEYETDHGIRGKNNYNADVTNGKVMLSYIQDK